MMKTITFDAHVHNGNIKMQEQYHNVDTKDIEVILLVKDQQTDDRFTQQRRSGKAESILQNYSNPVLISTEKSAWEIVVKGI